MKNGLIITIVAIAVTLNGCYSYKKEHVGVATGGALGGYIGSQIGSGKGQLAATAAGVLAGALIGGSMGRSMDELDRIKAQQALENTRTGSTTSWHNPDTGANYSVTPTRTYETAGATPCREYATTATIEGRTETVYGTACREPDGRWHTVN